ncbi:hypothetical protein K458DRAFT_91528 [Lentithecium fluviatile CBS 122367]|uniref:Secreted protein n=1 Tax=Lentithecium fluviatile CBS 122367 TaxID=1168545 RepID=A0A6G1IQS8_9PLEO|nr:hypothetical protein K458DRAFT_91528 [Lentithecium fluviatile CBS 122367]
MSARRLLQSAAATADSAGARLLCFCFCFCSAVCVLGWGNEICGSHENEPIEEVAESPLPKARNHRDHAIRRNAASSSCRSQSVYNRCAALCNCFACMHEFAGSLSLSWFNSSRTASRLVASVVIGGSWRYCTGESKCSVPRSFPQAFTALAESCVSSSSPSSDRLPGDGYLHAYHINDLLITYHHDPDCCDTV